MYNKADAHADCARLLYNNGRREEALRRGFSLVLIGAAKQACQYDGEN